MGELGRLHDGWTDLCCLTRYQIITAAGRLAEIAIWQRAMDGRTDGKILDRNPKEALYSHLVQTLRKHRMFFSMILYTRDKTYSILALRNRQ